MTTTTTPLTQIGNRPQNEKYLYGVFNVGDKCCVRGYSDIHPATVVAVTRNGSCVTVRYDKGEPDGRVMPEFVKGGFAAHCTNQADVTYKIEEDPNGSTATFTLRKWRGRYVWTHQGQQPDGRQKLGQGWYMFVDLNF